jgi:hypothetical protein
MYHIYNNNYVEYTDTDTDTDTDTPTPTQTQTQAQAQAHMSPALLRVCGHKGNTRTHIDSMSPAFRPPPPPHRDLRRRRRVLVPILYFYFYFYIYFYFCRHASRHALKRGRRTCAEAALLSSCHTAAGLGLSKRAACGPNPGRAASSSLSLSTLARSSRSPSLLPGSHQPQRLWPVLDSSGVHQDMLLKSHSKSAPPYFL